MPKRIPLKGGQSTLVDDADYQWLSRYKWYVDNRGYVLTGYKVLEYQSGTAAVRMHRAIMQAPKGSIVDHANHDKLDNQRVNLRFCTAAQSAHNRPKCLTIKSSSQFKGVSWESRASAWKAAIKVHNKSMCLGYFDDEIEAAKAYDNAAVRFHGGRACTNGISKPTPAGSQAAFTELWLITI